MNDPTKTCLKAATKAVCLADLRTVLKIIWTLCVMAVYLFGLMTALKAVRGWVGGCAEGCLDQTEASLIDGNNRSTKVLYLQKPSVSFQHICISLSSQNQVRAYFNVGIMK